MTKFAVLQEVDSASEQEGIHWERSLAQTSIVSSEEGSGSSDFSEGHSSVYEDGDVRTLAHADTSSTADIGSAVFQNFLCVFDERSQQHQRALKASQRQIALVKHESQEDAKRLVSLPQFLWQPGEGLCCRPGSVNFQSGTDQLIIFEEPDDGNCQDHKKRSQNPESLLFQEDEASVFSRVRSVMSDGGTTEDPRYVPRPSSTTPGLREASKFFDISNEAEISLLPRSSSQPPVVTPPRAVTDREMDTISSPHSLTKSRSTPPFSLRLLDRRTHQRSRSEDSNSKRTMSSVGSAFRLQKTAPEPDNVKKSKNPMRNLFRGTKLPSIRKPKFQSLHSRQNSGQTVTTGNSSVANDAIADIDTILSSLEATLKEREEHKVGNFSSAVVTPDSSKSRLKTFGQKLLKSRGSSPQPQDQPLSAQQDCESYSDTSLDELFNKIQNEEEYHEEDCDSDCSSEDGDIFFSTPYDQLLNKKGHKNAALIAGDRLSSRMSHFNNRCKPLQDSFDSSSSSIVSMNDLSRNSSVDTAKASNLTHDPIGDRARLRELRALLWKQQEELWKQQNAPPIDFEAGDNVIRVRDAMCEIEVLPKRAMGQSTTAAEF